jgi:hypothetical protein
VGTLIRRQDQDLSRTKIKIILTCDDNGCKEEIKVVMMTTSSSQ